MKAITKYLMMMIAMLAMCVSFSSCRETIEEPPVEFTLDGTYWEYSEDATVSGVTVKYEHSFSFSSSSAVYKIVETQQKGNESYTNFDTWNYTYALSDDGDLVVFTPTQIGNATLEGKIQSQMKMTVTNVSTGKTIGIFYKK